MNIFFRQAVRRPVFTVLMTLLLSLSVALSGIGFSAWMGARIQKEEISSRYTTIAVPIEPDLNNASFEKIETALKNKMYADWAAQEAPMLSMLDRRCLLSAHIAGSRSLSSSRIDPSEYNIAFDGECYNLAVLALRCENVAEIPTGGTLLYDAVFHVEQAVCLSDAYDSFPAPDTVHVYSDIREANGDQPFERGKTYLVFGQYQDFRVVLTDDGYRQIIKGGYRFLVPFPEIPRNPSKERASLEVGERGGQTYRYSAAGQLPWFSAYTGAADEFLSGGAASLWNEKILPLCRLNHESAAVVLTDSLTSTYSFNTGKASLLSGRLFTAEEYRAGAEVCIVSASYAEVNGLRLGDTLELDYYHSSYGRYSNGAIPNSRFYTGDPGPYYQRHYMSPDDAIGVCKKYTVVGIYTGARFAFGAYHYNADTIFVPKASVPNAQEYEYPGESLLNTFVLKNGSVESFEQYMQKQGLGKQFLYFDQGFSSVQESLEALEANALRLMLVGIGAFLLSSALFLFLNFRRMRPVIRGVRLLGRSARNVCGEVFTVLISLELPAVLLGAFAAALLFETVTERVLSQALPLYWSALLPAAGVELMLLELISLAVTAVSVNRGLMKTK